MGIEGGCEATRFDSGIWQYVAGVCAYKRAVPAHFLCVPTNYKLAVPAHFCVCLQTSSACAFSVCA